MTPMRAVVLDAPGPPETSQIRDLPIPVPRPGQVLIRVRAFGLNRYLPRGGRLTACKLVVTP